MIRNRPAALCRVLLVFAAWNTVPIGCTSGAGRTGAAPLEPPPAYADVVAAYNARTAKLQTLWAHANTVARGVRPDGTTTYNDGQGHFLVRQPAEVSLTAGKLGHDAFRIGADATRYWWFEFESRGRAFVGTHAVYGVPSSPVAGRATGFLHPQDVLSLMGIAALPADAPGSGASAGALPGTVRWAERAPGELVVDAWASESAGPRAFLQRLWLDAETLLPSRVELYAAAAGMGGGFPELSPFAWSELDAYGFVELDGVGGAMPRCASRAKMGVPGAAGSITLRLSSMEARRPGRIADANFDFDRLREIHRPAEVVDLDLPMRPAGTEGSGDAAH